MPSDHFDRIEPWYKFPSTPTDPGYNGYSISYDITSIQADIGIVLNKLDSKIKCHISDTNPFLIKPINRRRKYEKNKKVILKELEENDEDSEIKPNSKTPNFTIHIFLLTMKKIEFNFDKKITIFDNKDST